MQLSKSAKSVESLHFKKNTGEPYFKSHGTTRMDKGIFQIRLSLCQFYLRAHFNDNKAT